MRILLFVSQLWNLTGGEINTRDWALGLKARGHKVIVYTPVPGPLAETVRNGGIPVVDDPALINTAPDVMFGSGVNEIVTLSARFPELPAVQLAQQWNSWTAFPSRLPQVMLYMAVDEINRDMLVDEFGIAPANVRIVHNAVDLDRIPPRPNPLLSRPARALMFVKADEPYIATVRAVCKSRGIALDCVGYGADRVLDDPLAEMISYDLVIGSARTAIEGAAAGAAVLVADHRGLAGLLTSANFERFRAHNFGREVLTRALDFAAISGEIDGYDPGDAVAVSGLVRDSACLASQIERLEALFSEAIDLFQQAPPAPEERRKALSSYLGRHLPRFGEPAPRHARSHAHTSFEDRIGALHKRLSLMEHNLADMREAQVPKETELLGNGRNLLTDAERLDEAIAPADIATLRRVPEMSAGRSTYRIGATGGNGEHYLVSSLDALEGDLVFSLDVHAEGTCRFRLQLIDDKPNGAYSDFDLIGNRAVANRIGNAWNINSGAAAIGGGWHRVWVCARVPHKSNHTSFIVQLADAEGGLAFVPRGESLLVRCLQIEFGRYPTPYEHPSTVGVVAASAGPS
ncbi:MAG TPA: hypothetical protein VJ226_10315 [Bradyrhizobium sp.]|nr:hypothetical protein [Bradyrhizobium sp.]